MIERSKAVDTHLGAVHRNIRLVIMIAISLGATEDDYLDKSYSFLQVFLHFDVDFLY